MGTKEMKALRSIRGIPLRGKVRNEDTLKEIGVQDVMDGHEHDAVNGETMWKK